MFQPLFFFFVALLGGCGSSGTGVIDYFLTPDQQGRYAFEHKEFARAADRFEDPMWKGVAAYRAGRYQEAVDAFARTPSADGLFNMGNALVKGREYTKAIPAYEQALAAEPAHTGARKNLQLTTAIIAYLNEARRQGGTEVGADEYKYDNTSGEGQETVISTQGQLKPESAEQWMRTVDTQPQDYLRIKFALEAAK